MTTSTSPARARILAAIRQHAVPQAELPNLAGDWITFPDRQQMTAVVRVHHPDIDEKLLNEVLVRFYWLREQPELRKKPSTSELIDCN
jgi:MoxR-like ATPase